MAKRAMVFAGQGAQFVGMGKDLAEAFPECRALFARANEVLGFDLARLCYEGPLEELTKSDNCQPAIFTVSAACYTALRQLKPGLPCAACAGLSLGEWTALYAAGALSFDDALRVLRARLFEIKMQEQAEQIAELRGEYTKAEWGSQIRSYVLHPYQMVKDHRTNYEVGNAQSVLNGSLDGFIEAYLRARMAGSLSQA